MNVRLNCPLIIGFLLAAGSAYAQSPAPDAASSVPPASSALAAPPASSGTSAPAPTPAPSAEAAAAPGGETPSNRVGPPPEGKGQVVFFRPSSFSGAAVWFKVRENGVEINKLSNGLYFVQVEDPGIHTFTAATEATDTLRLEVDPGETYYVRGGITMGILMGRASLSPSDQETFEKAAHRLKLTKPVQPETPAQAPPSPPPAS